MTPRTVEDIRSNLSIVTTTVYALRETSVWVGEVEDKNASKVLKTLPHMRDAGLEFLRRIARNTDKNVLEVVIKKVEDEDEDPTAVSSTHGDGLIRSARKISVCGVFPETPEVWKKAVALWPLSKPANPPKDFLPQNMTDEELKAVHENFTKLLSRGDGFAVLGVSPDSSDEVFSTGTPLQGYTSLPTSPSEHASPLAHPCMNLVSAVAASSPSLSKPAVKRDKTAQYLLTGYDVYTVEEPCVMCCMGLLHSRLGRLFYLKKNNTFGGAGGCHSIHEDPRLNHHYHAYHYKM
eukprot:TRINITY_DN5294_c0_g4_i1.p1 TRINITY_DN5294_c0_g4~~TRINITY_DN5294_c0_g4_i1.p1  ORF type:complete len:292 (+),score=76.03 TRINITY_DN5294_c0_g4_i1:66-941(+)